VILLFFLLVTPEIVAAGVPQYMSMVLFIFPILFFVVLFNSRYHTQAPKRNLLVGITLVVGLIAYFSLISNRDDPDLPLSFPALARGARSLRHPGQPADRLRVGGLRELAHRLPDRAGHRSRHQDAGLRGRGANPRARARGTSCCGRSCPTRAGR
jgi:hypothetical protein